MLLPESVLNRRYMGSNHFSDNRFDPCSSTSSKCRSTPPFKSYIVCCLGVPLALRCGLLLGHRDKT
jgi:hypothetical protein